jgi:hypothetical protein
MKKYLVDVYIPAAGRHMDAFIPCGKRVGEAAFLLAGIAETVCEGAFLKIDNSVLISAENGLPFDRNKTVDDAGIKNASRLILI